MIPPMLVLGLALGRWWRLALLVGTLGWPVLLLATDVMAPDPLSVLLVAVLALANTAAGVILHQALLRGVRLLRAKAAT